MVFFKRIQDNWRSGLTVALISIPLSISLAVASGATPAMGLTTAVWAGLLAALFGGSHFNIIGPAGALSAALATFSITHGMDLLPVLAIMTGLCIALAYLLKLERYLVLIPAPVMQGFSVGVGIIIGLGQLNFALGLSALPKHSEFIENVSESIRHIGSAHLPTFLVFIIFLIGLFALIKLTPKIPGAILLTPFGIGLGALSATGTINLNIETLGQHFPGTSIHLFSMPHVVIDASLIGPALGIAFIGIIETLISAKIADNLTKTTFNRRREMLGLAIANIGSGLFGGLPATGVFVRTGLNVRSGATHKTSAGINAISIALISLFLFHYFTYIPMAVIASILVFAAIRMVEIKHLQELWRHARRDFALAMATTITMVLVDTVAGIVVGSLLALLLFIEHLSKGQYEMTVNDEHHTLIQRLYTASNDAIDPRAQIIVYSLKGDLSYLDAEAHIQRLQHLGTHVTGVVLRLRELSFIDLEGIQAIDDIIKYLQSTGKTIYVSSINPAIKQSIEHSQLVTQLQRDGAVFEHTQFALQALGFSQAHLKESVS